MRLLDPCRARSLGENPVKQPVEIYVEEKRFMLHYEIPREYVTFIQVTMDLCDSDFDGLQRRSDLVYAFWAENKALLGQIIRRLCKNFRSGLELMKHGR